MARRQAWMRDELIEDGADPLAFVGCGGRDATLAEAAVAMREHLELSADWGSRQRSWTDALRHLRNRVEASRVRWYSTASSATTRTASSTGENSRVSPWSTATHRSFSSTVRTSRRPRCSRWRTSRRSRTERVGSVRRRRRKMDVPARLGEVEPVLGQTGRVHDTGGITAKSAARPRAVRLKWTRPSTSARSRRQHSRPPAVVWNSGGRWSLRRVLRARSAEEAGAVRRAAAGHRGRVLRRLLDQRAATGLDFHHAAATWRRGERPRAPPAPADAERTRPGDRQRIAPQGEAHDGGRSRAGLQSAGAEQDPRGRSSVAEAGRSTPPWWCSGHPRSGARRSRRMSRAVAMHSSLAKRRRASIRRHRPDIADPPLDAPIA